MTNLPWLPLECDIYSSLDIYDPFSHICYKAVIYELTQS